MEISENIPLEETDAVQHCGRTYKSEFLDTEIKYRINFFTDTSFLIVRDIQNPRDAISVSQNTINEIEIVFTSLELKHLAGIGKFSDINKQDRPQAIYEKMIGIHESGDILTLHDISRSDFFFDDTDKSQNKETADMTDEEFQKKIKEEKLSGKKVLKSEFLGRLSALENLSQIIAQSNPQKSIQERPFIFKIYAWDRTAPSFKRPHNSKINANFLIEIQNPNNSEKPYTDFFIVREDDGTYRGMSVFPSEYSYAKDDKKRTATEITALSVETFKSDKSVSKVSADDKTIHNSEEAERNRNSSLAQNPNKKEKDDFMAELTVKRESVIKSREKASIGKRAEYYCKLLGEILFSSLTETDIFGKAGEQKQDSIIRRLHDARNTNPEYVDFEISMIKLKYITDKLEQCRKSINADYETQLKDLEELLSSGNRELCQYAVKLLTMQKKSCNQEEREWIDIEIESINKIAAQKESRLFGGYNIMNFQHTDKQTMPEFAMQGNTAVIPFQSSFIETLRKLAEQFRTALREITDNITSAVRQALSKPQNADTVPSETEEQNSEPVQSETAPEAEPAPEKDITDDDEFIIKNVYPIFADSIGTQGYENYAMIVPENKLDFQIPLTYQTEQIQEQEHDFLSDKAVPTEFKKKQTEYDDR